MHTKFLSFISKKTAYLVTSFFLMGTGLLYSIDESSTEDIDIEALRDWVNTKRQVTVKELGGNLSISGEVRTEMQITSEKRNGIKQRGANGAVSGVPSDTYDIEVNLLLDYRTDRTWATAKIEFDDNAGAISGDFSGIALERAFLGFRMINKDTFTVDLEFGRRNFGYTFDSRIEFGSFMDGIMLKYDHAFDQAGDFYFHGGPFLIDERDDHYGYVGEFGLLNILNTGLYSKYSLINWNTKHFTEKDQIKQRFYRFTNSQGIIGYKFQPKWLGKMITIYSAFLYNHAAHRLEVASDKKANMAGYGGFSVGEIRKKGDWSFDINYQVVGAQSIPEFDVSGIGRGNAAKVGFYSDRTRARGDSTTRETAVGGTNYKGVAMQLLYLATNNITVFQSWQQSINLNDNIGPFIRYKQYELELIYAF